MIRTVSIACALGLLVGPLAAQEPELGLERTTLAEDGLAGPVRAVETMTAFSATATEGGPPRSWVQVLRVEYDRAGHRRSLVQTDSGTVTARTEYAYGLGGRITGYVRFAGDAELQRVTYVYDHRGRLVWREVAGEMPRTDRFVRDARGRLREVRRDRAGRVRWVIDSRYDERGRLAERTLREEDAVRGQLVERAELGPDGRPRPPGVQRWSYTYDLHGNWTRKAWLSVPEGGGEPVEHAVVTRVIAYW